MIPLKSNKQSRQKENKLMIMFDPVHLFTTSKQPSLFRPGRTQPDVANSPLVIASDVRGAMYISLGEFYKAYLQDELYKTYAQRLSIRTTSRQFTHYRTRAPILLSDFVTFNCSIPTRRCRKPSCTVASFSYIGRVISVGRDFRTAVRNLGQVVL